ncbi:hypothetical protein Avbf_16663, partial [Armadillidium vulgare]
MLVSEEALFQHVIYFRYIIKYINEVFTERNALLERDLKEGFMCTYKCLHMYVSNICIRVRWMTLRQINKFDRTPPLTGNIFKERESPEVEFKGDVIEFGKVCKLLFCKGTVTGKLDGKNWRNHKKPLRIIIQEPTIEKTSTVKYNTYQFLNKEGYCARYLIHSCKNTVSTYYLQHTGFSTVTGSWKTQDSECDVLPDVIVILGCRKLFGSATRRKARLCYPYTITLSQSSLCACGLSIPQTVIFVRVRLCSFITYKPKRIQELRVLESLILGPLIMVHSTLQPTPTDPRSSSSYPYLDILLK